MHSERIRQWNDISVQSGPIVYWMSRDQRVEDNWALIYAQDLAQKHNRSLMVVFNMVTTFLAASWRQYSFMLAGLREVEENLAALNVPFYVLVGDPVETIPGFIQKHRVGALVTDFSPLNITKSWKQEVVDRIHVPLYEVDAHNIVPCWVASTKQEFSARTMRLKLARLVPSYLIEFPKLQKQTANLSAPRANWEEIVQLLKVDFSVPEITWCQSGTGAAKRALHSFVEKRLQGYDIARNDPNKKAQSQLSPYLHFGQISAQRVALVVQKLMKNNNEADAVFLEELIVRRELADNFCFYNEFYDQYNGFPAWARKTLEEHAHDKRDFIYALEQFELAKTHDELWNSSQREMVRTGKMHGFMRMYWAKKILEWTKSPADALQIAIYLNDKYELDGRDPNGYAGIAWSIGGLHDRPWFKRAVFGTVRYMNASGCARKFDVEAYIQANQSI